MCALPRPPGRRCRVRLRKARRLCHRRLGVGRWAFASIRLESMYSVTKRLDFCYGHRLLDYDGVCKHPHGHNAVVEIDVRTDRLDKRNMVADFSDIKRVVK